MKKLPKKAIFLIVSFIVLGILAVLYFSAPSFLYHRFIADQRKNAKLTIKSVDIPDFNIVYAEGGAGDTIIMLHGFGADKDNWPAFAGYFTDHYRVIIPDLPGFGDSTKFQEGEFGIMFLAEKMHAFAKKLNLTKFHLVGHSMGGNIAGNYAVAYSEMVKTLALIDAARVISPVRSEFDLLLEKGVNPYIVKNVEDYDAFMEFLFYRPPQIPSFMKNYLAEQYIKTSALYEKSFDDGWEKSIFPESVISKITTPTLIIWGDSDKNFHVSCAGIFQRNIKNSKLVIIKECGHVPIMEKPKETAAAYREFLRENNY